jgi:peptide-methionine (S)-S-oxide reductase
VCPGTVVDRGAQEPHCQGHERPEQHTQQREGDEPATIVCLHAPSSYLAPDGSLTTSRSAAASLYVARSAYVGTQRGKETAMESIATFAAGCFWQVEAAFREIPGVLATSVGYTGGWYENPTYEDVCTSKTGHAEAVEVVYDPARVSYDELLQVFWRSHDPTTRDRQGPDVGPQYRSAVFFHSEEQRAAAIASKENLDRSGRLERPIVTEVTPASRFYRAEEYHQRYLEKRGLATCHIG